MPRYADVEGLGRLEFPDETADEVIDRTVAREVKRKGLAEEQRVAEQHAGYVGALSRGLDWTEALAKGATPQGLLESAGKVINYAGDVAAGAAEDVIAGERTPTSVGNLPNPLGPRFSAAILGGHMPQSAADTPIEQGVVDAARTLPTIAGGLALGSVGVPMPAAFGGLMGASAYEAAKRVGADDLTALRGAAEASLIGAVVPGVAKAGAAGAARGLGLAVQRGLLSGRRTLVQKTVEALAGQGTVSLFLEGMSLPEYIAATPEERTNLFLRHMTANAAFLALDIPNLRSSRPSATQQHLLAKVGDVLAEAFGDSKVADEIMAAVDDEAVQRAAEAEARAKPEAPTESEPITGVDEALAKTGETPLPPAPPSKPKLSAEEKADLQNELAEEMGDTAEAPPPRGSETPPVTPEAQPLYHGSFETGLTQLSTSRYGDFGSGVYLTSSPEFAGRFADSTNFDVSPDVRKSRGRGRVYRVNLSKGLRVFTADKTPLTKEEKAFWESTEEGLENDVNTRADLRDAKTGRNLGAFDRSDWEYNSKDWDEFARKFEYDALQFGDELVVKDSSKVSVDLDYTAKDEPAPRPTKPVPRGTGAELTGPEEPPTHLLTPSNPRGTPAVPVGVLPPARQAFTLIPRLRRRVQVERVRLALEGIVQSVGGNVPIRSRRFYDRALGIFKTRERVVRLGDLNDLPTASHEIAHGLSRQLWPQGVRQAVPAPVARELHDLGVALYGTRRPTGGYHEEGFAEFLRYYLTTDAARTHAPLATAWFDGTLLLANQRLARAMGVARRSVDTWRGQGLLAQGRSQQRPHEGRLRELLRATRRSMSGQGFVESGKPIEDLARLAERRLGNPLAPSEDPFRVFTMQRGRSGAVAAHMAREEMLDIWGRPTGAPGLAEGLAPVLAGRRPGDSRRETLAQFWDWIYARRARELLTPRTSATGQPVEPRNPGISLQQADAMLAAYGRPEFDLAGAAYDKWWDGVLDYVASASPNMTALVGAIRQGAGHYAPLARHLKGEAVRRAEQGGQSSGLRRLTGSARAIKEIRSQTILGAQHLIEAAHREQVHELIHQLATNVPGLGHLIERVPLESQPRHVNVEQVRQQLEDAGVDTTALPDDTILNFYQAAERPHGVDPVYVRQTPTGPVWYQVSQGLYDALSHVDPKRLGLAANLLFASARVFKLGTTGLRPSFSFWTNLVRDAQTFLPQSATHWNPVGRLYDWSAGLAEVLVDGLTGRRSEALENFKRSGVTGANFLGTDIGHAKREARSLFQGRLVRRIASPIETARDIMSATESASRFAEWRRLGRQLGWTPGTPLTPDQAVLMNVAAKRVTTDFSASGDFGGDPILEAAMRSMPFRSANVQGTRTFLRTLRDHPVQALLYGLATFTLPTLFNWYKNKDELWYKALPWRERFLFTNVETPTGEVVQVPKPYEWGNMFAVIPEAIVDSAYREDPEAVMQALGHLFETQNPFDLPPLGRMAWEQARNKVAFWDRPIVPRNQVDLMPGEQLAPYTSLLARKLGETFPTKVSPRRVDHAVRALTGGAFSDALEKLDFTKRKDRGKEPADMPIFGRVFRRGGEFSPRSIPLENMYDLYGYWDGRTKSKKYPLTQREKAWADLLRDRMELVRATQKKVEESADPLKRREAYRKLTKYALTTMEYARKHKLTEDQVVLPPAVQQKR